MQLGWIRILTTDAIAGLISACPTPQEQPADARLATSNGASILKETDCCEVAFGKRAFWCAAGEFGRTVLRIQPTQKIRRQAGVKRQEALRVRHNNEPTINIKSPGNRVSFIRADDRGMIAFREPRRLKRGEDLRLSGGRIRAEMQIDDAIALCGAQGEG